MPAQEGAALSDCCGHPRSVSPVSKKMKMESQKWKGRGKRRNKSFYKTDQLMD